MAIAIFILLLFFLLYRLFGRKGGLWHRSSTAGRETLPTVAPPAFPTPGGTYSTGGRPGGRWSDKPEDAQWKMEKRVRFRTRRTYIQGVLVAKFNGELDMIKDLQQFVRERYFDIQLYDARIERALYRKHDEGPFPEPLEAGSYSGVIEPNPLPCVVRYEGIVGVFSVLLHEVRLSNVDFDKYRLLHMEEDEMVFGIVEALVTGYMLEHFREEYEERVPVIPVDEAENGLIPDARGEPAMAPEPLTVTTGRTQTEGGYRWQERRSADSDRIVWANPAYTRQDRLGCGAILGIIALIFYVVIFLAAIGPQGILTLLAVLAAGLVLSFLSGLFRPALWLLACILLLAGFASLSHRVAHGRDRFEVPFSHDQPRESSFVVEERSVSGDPEESRKPDSLMVHHRVWKDYSDNTYEGDIWVRTRDMAESRAYKDHLVVTGGPMTGYDRMLGSLAVYDRGLLPGVYGMLDSLRAQKGLDAVAFAKVVVSFVQDIPYALILDRDCNPDLYSDPFTRRYLQTADARCSGFQRFGINTPVEFMGSLQGDCDTRTLLLFTLLDHYGYDVAILSSEIYSHSLLGIASPGFTGLTFPYRGKSYVLWETTSPQMPPGVISISLDNLSNWRISITSKH